MLNAPFSLHRSKCPDVGPNKIPLLWTGFARVSAALHAQSAWEPFGWQCQTESLSCSTTSGAKVAKDGAPGKEGRAAPMLLHAKGSEIDVRDPLKQQIFGQGAIAYT